MTNAIKYATIMVQNLLEEFMMSLNYHPIGPMMAERRGIHGYGAISNPLPTLIDLVPSTTESRRDAWDLVPRRTVELFRLGISDDPRNTYFGVRWNATFYFLVRDDFFPNSVRRLNRRNVPKAFTSGIQRLE